ncbi:MAG: tetratricopeptide repeat protein, partial [Proteobacteria bacterium]|nr:tetratricopeptide repeat protein [Pseudomonadota bacterium]
TTFKIPGLQQYADNPWLPLLAALLWLLHPLDVQAVTYIIQRFTSLAAMFYILSMWLYALGRLEKKRSHLVGSAISGLLSMASKEYAVTLPFFLFLYEWFFFQNMDRTWLKRKTLYIGTAGILLLFILFQLIPAVNAIALIQRLFTPDYLNHILLTHFRGMAFFLSLYVFPHPSRLNLDHEFPPSASLLQPISTLPSVLLLLGMLLLAIWIAKRQRFISFCIFWTLGQMMISYSVIGMDTIYEHRVYLSSMLFFAMWPIIAFRYIKPAKAALVLLCAVTLAFSWWTYQRNQVWADPIALWRDVSEKSPHKARPHHSLAYWLIKQGQGQKALVELKKAMELAPDDYNIRTDIGNLLLDLGRIDEAVEQLSYALKLEPEHSIALTNLGRAMYMQGKLEKAASYFAKAVAAKPDLDLAHHNLAAIFNLMGRTDEAIEHYRIVLRLDPQAFIDRYYLADLLIKQGKYNEAIEHLEETLRLKPDLAVAHNLMGVALASQGRIREAVVPFQTAVRLDPNLDSARQNLARVMTMLSSQKRP